MSICGIYGFKNTTNGKWYIGQSVDIGVRKRGHLSKLRGNNHVNAHLQAAFHKYGEDNLEFRVLEETQEGLLDIQERLWIIHYKSDQPEFGYNLRMGGNIGHHPSEETRRKSSLSHKGKSPSAESRLKLSVALMGRPSPMKGRHQSEEARRKIAEGHRGKPKLWLRGRHQSDETKKKRADALRGQHRSEESRQRMRVAAKLRCKNNA
jgi:group I intron endonuclease